LCVVRILVLVLGLFVVAVAFIAVLVAWKVSCIICEGEASGKRLLELPRKISCHRIILPRQDYARWWVLVMVLFRCQLY
jgi:hypothetical protein